MFDVPNDPMRVAETNAAGGKTSHEKGRLRMIEPNSGKCPMSAYATADRIVVSLVRFVGLVAGIDADGE